MSKISKRPAPVDREEGEASDCVDLSPQVAPPTRDCLSKIKDRSRKELREAARKKGLEERIEIGKQEPAETVKDLQGAESTDHGAEIANPETYRTTRAGDSAFIARKSTQ